METFSALLAICAGNSPVTGEFPAQRPVTRSFDVLFDLRLNKRLSKQSWGWWFETQSRPLWRHYNAILCCYLRTVMPPEFSASVSLVLGQEDSEIIRSIPWLLMPWLLASPGHQQPRSLLHRIIGSLFRDEQFQSPASYQSRNMLYKTQNHAFLYLLKTCQCV